MKIISKKIQTKKPKINNIPVNSRKKFKFIKEYFLNNIKEYSIVGIMFIIGIFLGVMFINNSAGERQMQIGNYINTYIQNFKDVDNINYLELSKIAIQKNMALAIILWFAGTTIIGIPIVLGIILFRRRMLRIYHISMHKYFRFRKRFKFCNNNYIFTKFNIYTCNNFNWSKLSESI